MAPLAVSLGDPAGIGPEIIAATWRQHGEALRNEAPFFVVGGKSVLDAIFRRLHGAGRGCTAEIAEPAEALEVFRDRLPILSTKDVETTPGQPSKQGAALALHSLREATRLAVEGRASGIVTAPVAKVQLAKVGFDFPGQTEFFADACDIVAEDAVMMLAGPQLRTVPLTVHCALAEVPRLLSVELIHRRTAIAARALQRDFGIDTPRIAVTGLNPHAGEDGKFGSEDAEIIAPAIAALRKDGIDATGPHSADALFAPHKRGEFDLAVCMYHDQALIPVKALDFDAGVNVTLGLPIIRTSPDHGTAFDIAGQGIAQPGAMVAAIRMAGECARQRANG